ncbi:MAG: alcohol dehydrogenase [Planctomycetia bacterium 21-64-5]|nr:MAG: alcohol dehydrogenase [Planctomycetia bacterium 21-64-5]HQU42699.1 iron-containing alcohol dehydrogenase [Pirellulales bacterium]
MRTTWNFYSAGQLVFGRGAANQTGQLAEQLGLRRVLLVADERLIAAGLDRGVRDALTSAGIAVEVFGGGQPEPSLDLVERCLAEARRIKPDGVLGLGGGSNMDLAKIVAAVLTHGGGPRDYVGENRVSGPVLPLVCIPTTSGTGSEVTAASVLTDTANQIKVGVLSNYLRPKLAIVDPLLTVSCPAKVTADSGIDALTHAIEAYTAVDNEAFPLPEGECSVYQGRHPLADGLAEKAIELIGRHLVAAVREPQNLEAREGMSLAATVAGLAFSNTGVALVHAMEYPVGGAVHCSHGAGNGLLLPFVMRYNLPVRVKQFARVAQLLGEDISGLTEAQGAERAIATVERLKAAIGIPVRLRDLGVTSEQLPLFAQKAFGIKRILRVNPRVPTVADIEEVYRAAF